MEKSSSSSAIKQQTHALSHPGTLIGDQGGLHADYRYKYIKQLLEGRRHAAHGMHATLKCHISKKVESRNNVAVLRRHSIRMI